MSVKLFNKWLFSEPQPKNIISCTICTDLVEIVDETLTSNGTISDVEAAIDAACDILIGIEDSCKDFVHNNLEMVIDLLVNEYLSPEAICNGLGLCPWTVCEVILRIN